MRENVCLSLCLLMEEGQKEEIFVSPTLTHLRAYHRSINKTIVFKFIITFSSFFVYFSFFLCFSFLLQFTFSSSNVRGSFVTRKRQNDVPFFFIFPSSQDCLSPRQTTIAFYNSSLLESKII